MRISFDLDGVLADMDSALARIAAEEFGVRRGPAPEVRAEHITPGSRSFGAYPAAPIVSRLTRPQETRLWQRVRDTRNFWESLPEHEPGIVRRIQALAYDLHWEALFVTQRPDTAGRTVQVQSQRWLHKHGFDLPAVYTVPGSRGRMADAFTLDVHVDDRIEHAVDVASGSRAWSILVWRDDGSFDRVTADARGLGIAVVRDVAEALARVEAADRGDAKGSRRRAGADDNEEAHTGAPLLERLKQTFGWS